MSDDRYVELERALDEDGDPGVELLTGLYPSVAAVVAERDRLRADAVLGRVLARTLRNDAADRSPVGMGWYFADVLGYACDGHDTGLAVELDADEREAVRHALDAKEGT